MKTVVPPTPSLRLPATTRRTVVAPVAHSSSHLRPPPFFEPRRRRPPSPALALGFFPPVNPRLPLTRLSLFSTASMLGRANKTFEARSASTASATSSLATKVSPRANLEKALFPSSSPTISDFYKKPSAGSFQAARRQPAPVFSPAKKAPLQTRSPNIAYPPSAAAASVVTLCSKAGSFADEEPEVSIVPPPTMQSANVQPRAAAATSSFQKAEESDLLAYGWSLDDITDDDNLDLDFQSPGAVPQAAASSVNTAAVATALPTTNAESALPTNRSFASAVSWPSSSPSHFAPVSGSRPFGQRVPSAKRDMPHPDSHGTGSRTGDPPSSSPLPAAKKRTMPKHWSQPAPEPAAQRSSFSTFNTPAAKPASTALWDASASAVKAQKKQLKDQVKKPMPDGGNGNSNGNGGDGGIASHFADKDAAKRFETSLQKPAGKLSLSSEQEHIRNLVCYERASVFFTGPAGTGKSVLMRAIIEDLRSKYAKDPERLGVTASTGLAACNIGGMTLHSFAGIGLGKEDAQTLVRKIRRNPKAKQRWLKTQTLVIDEISMVDGDLFDKLSNIGRSIRNNGRPWGGIQLVLTGDFFQLPPVPDREKRDVKFAFDAKTWPTSIQHTIGLTEVFRQRDPEFAQMLNEMRLGIINDKTVQTFKSLQRPLNFDDGIDVTELFPTRVEVENSNNKRLRALPGKAYRYESYDSGEPQIKDKLLQNMMAPKSIELRVGAQVMLIKNMDESLVNGSLGKVIQFMSETEYEASEYSMGFMPAMDETARKRTSVLNSYLNSTADGSGALASGGRMFPLVQFTTAFGSKRTILVRLEEWKVELPDGKVQASRSQIPLILAWALSIHKAQGQTLERVKVDLGRVFEKGQAYVALSRATTKAGLQVLRFEKHKVMAHPKVVEFYQQLYSAETALRSKGGKASILAFTRKVGATADTKAAAFGG